ncbi:MAG TPA: hypothetical protein VFJ87_08935 [Rhodanobacteraceae bacterium]|nr:hypothetical protein [Rhodanobacteraceae bacterium]
MKRLAWLGILFGLVVPTLAFAATTPVHVSMVVTGTVSVNPDGSVKAYTIDHADQLPSGVQSLLKSSVPEWTFDAIKAAHKTVPTQARMSVQVTGTVTGTSKQKVDGKTVEQNTVQIGVADIDLHCPPPHADMTFVSGCDPNAGLAHVAGVPPAYPIRAVRAGMEAVVDLRLEIGRDGRVLHAAVRQVNLYSRIPDLSLYRKIFADPTLEAAHEWRYRVPISGPNAGRDRWMLDQRVKFYIDGGHVATIGYGQWLAYLPGPIAAIPWADQGSTTVTRLPEMTVEASLMR